MSLYAEIGEEVVDFVGRNFGPEDVFDIDELTDWAREKYDPDDIFDGDALDTWATKNGYISEDEYSDVVADNHGLLSQIQALEEQARKAEQCDTD